MQNLMTDLSNTSLDKNSKSNLVKKSDKELIVTQATYSDLPQLISFANAVFKEVFTEDKYMTDKQLDIKKINPFTLTMPDNNYWSIGENLGKAWNIGKSLKKK